MKVKAVKMKIKKNIKKRLICRKTNQINKI